MTTANIVDAARVELLLYELRLTSIGGCGPSSPSNSTRKVGGSRVPAVLVEHEMADRGRRGFERHTTEAAAAGKTLARFDFEVVPTILKAQLIALASGDTCLEKGAISCYFGLPAAARAVCRQPGLAQVENG